MGRPLLRWLPPCIVAATVLYTMSVYSSLPERMATHWGINGQPNGWSPRAFGAWLLPGIMVVMWIFFAILPMLDPQKLSSGKTRAVFDLLATAILAFQASVQYVMLGIALGHAIDINTVVYVGMGLLFGTIGLAIPKPNGFLMVISGALTIVSALTAPPHVTFTIFVASSIFATLGAVLRSSRH